MSKKLNKKEIIDKLRNDKHYFGDFGKKYLSNSSIKVLNTDFESYGGVVKKNQALEEGSYFHALILEPQKAKNFPIWTDTETRGKAYKDHLEEKGLDYMMKTSEAEEIQNMVHHFLNKNTNIKDLLNDKDAKKEEPNIGKIKINNKEYDFKGKADLISHGLIIDFKTTKAPAVDKFIWDAKSFGYASQAFIYQSLWSLPITFIGISKVRKFYGHSNLPYYKVYVCPTTEKTILDGKDQVEKALKVYEEFYGKNPKQVIEDVVYHTKF
tara:strand:- start:395 stop:1195 length:801 start_codon:yes stop_codon:yes gene_type:complete